MKDLREVIRKQRIGQNVYERALHFDFLLGDFRFFARVQREGVAVEAPVDSLPAEIFDRVSHEQRAVEGRGGQLKLCTHAATC